MTDAENSTQIYVVRKGWYPDDGDEHIDNLLFNEPYCKTFQFKKDALEYHDKIYMDDYDSGLFPQIFNITVSNPVEVRFTIEETVVSF